MRAIVRWSLCAGIVILGHSLAALSLLPVSAPVDDEGGTPVLALTLSTIATPPRPTPAPPPKTKGTIPAPPTPTRPVATATSTTLGHEAPVTRAAVQSWQQRLIAQIERHKHFPPDAHGQTGTVRILFRLDRRGRVLRRQILVSSGVAALDRAAYDLLQSAEPLPVPPPGISDAALTCVLPIRYPPKHGL